MRHLWFYLGKTLTDSRISLYSKFAKLLATLAFVLAVFEAAIEVKSCKSLAVKV